MKLDDLKPAPGATSARKRVGRGIGSGLGKTSGKGHKGQKSRSGYSHRFGFEGGQMPLVRRIPKRGFNNDKFRTEMEIVNVADLDRLFDDGDTVDRATLAERGLVSGKRPVKILGDGDLGTKLEVAADRFSKSAREKIEAAGGSCRAVDQ